MGVSGCGKTTVGERLSEKTGWPFFDGDDYHPPDNVARMAAGQPLNDQDRRPWLDNLHQLILDHLADNESLILACSALKKSYREILRGGEGDRVDFVYLQGSFDLIYQRMTAREDHYMKPGMLRSQFDTLEEPEQALVIDIDTSIEQIVSQIIHNLELSNRKGI